MFICGKLTGIDDELNCILVEQQIYVVFKSFRNTMEVDALGKKKKKKKYDINFTNLHHTEQHGTTKNNNNKTKINFTLSTYRLIGIYFSWNVENRRALSKLGTIQ